MSFGKFSYFIHTVFHVRTSSSSILTPQPLKTVQVLSPMVSGRCVAYWNIVSQNISVTVRYRQYILVGGHWLWGVGVQRHSVTMISPCHSDLEL